MFYFHLGMIFSANMKERMKLTAGAYAAMGIMSKHKIRKTFIIPLANLEVGPTFVIICSCESNDVKTGKIYG